LGQFRTVTSRENPAVKRLRALAADAREARRQGRTLLDGIHLIEACLRKRGAPELIIVSESGLRNREVAELADSLATADRIQLPDSIFRDLSEMPAPVGILGVVAIPPEPTAPIAGSCVIMDAVQDAGNVGAILRTAAAAGITDVVLGPGCAGAWTPKVVRAGQGAHFALSIREQLDLPRLLRDCPSTSVATVARGGIPVFDVDLAGEVAWIFGNEGAGIQGDLIDLATFRVTIPLAADTESLNVGAAAAVCLFEAVRQKRVARGNGK